MSDKFYMASDYGTLDDDADYEAFPCTDGVPLEVGEETDDDGIVVFKELQDVGWTVVCIRSKLGSEFDGKTLGSGGWVNYVPDVNGDGISLIQSEYTGHWDDDKDSATFESLTVSDTSGREYEITLSGKTVSDADRWTWSSECGDETVRHGVTWNDNDNLWGLRPDYLYLAHVRRI